MQQLLCYGDSNTWGLIPGTNKRYEWGVRWTSILQEKFNKQNVRVVEEGLCGRTTIFEDAYREHRNGLATLPLVLETMGTVDAAILMLGTNDCKSYYNNSASQITKGLEQCIEKLEEQIPREHILIISPIYLGEDVWKEEFDPEFDRNSVDVSKELKVSYKKLADKHGISFLAASDYVSPSHLDNEHMDENGHRILAETIYAAVVNKLTNHAKPELKAC